jgi:hypothetical protein
MDAEFDRRWHNSLPPFDGLTVTLREYVSLPLLQPILVGIVDKLFAYRPNASLSRLLDWYEHDGFINAARPSSWQELRSIVTSPESLVARFHLGDSYVCEGFFPADRDFYLRFYIPDAYDNPFHQFDDPDLVHYGIFDVTGPESLVTPIAAAIEICEGCHVDIMLAKLFFNRRYSG